MVTTTSLFLFILVMGIFILLRYSERNRLQMTLVFILAAWVFFFGGVLAILLFLDVQFDQTLILYFSSLICGFVAFFIFMLYPAMAIRPSILRSPHTLLFLAPAIVMYVVYVVWHVSNGLDFNKEFYSFAELLLPENSTTVIMLLLLSLSFYVYFGALMYNIFKLASIYQRYIEGTYADKRHNIIWLRTFMIATLCIGVVYFIHIVYHNAYTYGLYMCVTGVSFIMIIDNALYHKPFDSPKDFDVKWSLKKGWYVNEIKLEPSSGICVTNAELLHMLESWFEEEKPYCNVEFTAKRVEEKFPMLDYNRLCDVMEKERYTFQSYVRKMRVDEALRIMHNNTESISNKEIAYKVGFSHYSSFSRAFTAVTGRSPSKI